jgi:uncharacterized protein (TIGR02300 family)
VNDVAKPELGTKRLCPSCGTKYYDLNRDPIVCPNCGTIFEVAAGARAPERIVVAAKPEPVIETEEVEREEGVVSLEEAEVEVDLAPEGEEEEEAVVPAEEVEEEIEAGDEDTFLEEDEEGGDDVTDLLDVDAEDEDER